MSTESDIPQWKKDLIARLRSQNRRTAQLVSSNSSSSVQEPATVSSSTVEQCECIKMVQERWGSEEDEDLHYGPGIVNKLKERYLSLAQREKPRPSILRKAASLEDLLDDGKGETNRLFRTKRDDEVKNANNRYRNAKRTPPEMKRARSVEAISQSEDKELQASKPKRESMHEEMLITKGNDLIIIPSEKPTVVENTTTYTARVNRPKRIAPVMNEKEKPPVDVVKQAKMIFERRPEQRTKPPQQTGEVAAKVENFKKIIVQNKVSKKPAVKAKPVITAEKPKTNGIRTKKDLKSPPVSPRKQLEFSKEKTTPSLPSPIPDISRVDFKDDDGGVKSTSLTETPDLIITSSPLPAVNSPSFRISATENFIKEEIRLASLSPTKPSPPSTAAPDIPNSMTFNFAKTAAAVPKSQNHLPPTPTTKTVNNALNTQTPPSQPLKVEINGVNETKKSATPPPTPPSPQSSDSAARILVSAKPNLTILEIEKNLINTAKTLEQPKNNNSSVIAKCADEVTIKVPKVKKPPREAENNSIVFKFTDRKDVPDYVHNDGVKRVAKLEKPKVGEGGIILLPGASIGESFTDEDEEIQRSLECPPSPCDVTFINDNILINGKSSRWKTKKAKLKISFVEEGPEVYEYPSESSLLIEDSPTSPTGGAAAQMRHTVPSLAGNSSLANYTPKSMEDFQPGVTRSVVVQSKPESVDTTDLFLEEVEKPILFSSGANSDILF